MIHAKELRFGNKVQTQHGEIIAVQQILCNTLIYDTLIKVSRETAAVGKYYKTDYSTQFVEVVKEAEYQEISGIFLTPRILEKCGFRNFVREDWIYSIGNSHIDFAFTADGLRLREALTSQINLQYVHQLQNFIFAISGHEMEVDL